MPELTLSQAAKVTGKSKSTLNRAIKSGRLSASRNEDGTFSIDPSELARVFPENVNQNGSMTHRETAQERLGTAHNPSSNNALWEELATLRERARVQEQLLTDRQDQIADLKEDRDRWRTQASGLLADLRAIQEAKPAPLLAPILDTEPETSVPAEASPNPRSWWPWRRG